MIWRGEIHDVDLGRPVGHEPAFTRPAIVVSADLLNNGPGGLVVVVPVTSADYGLRSHVELVDPSASSADSPGVSPRLARPTGLRVPPVRAAPPEHARHDDPHGYSTQNFRTHPLAAERSGLHHASYARCDQLRVVATARLTVRRGAVTLNELERIDNALRSVLDL